MKVAVKSNLIPLAKKLSRNRRRKIVRRSKIKRLIAVIKLANVCMDCRSKEELTFDHVKGKKLFNIGRARNYTIGQINKELMKCEIVCRSCYDIREYKRDFIYSNKGFTNRINRL